MARTLFIIDDATLKSLGSAIVAKMMDEVKSIFSFAPKFTVLMTAQDKIPEKIDFTDSIVKVVATEADVTAMQNQAEQQELRSIEFAIKNNNLNIKMASFKRSSAKPERGGVSWQAKEVLAVGGQKVALVMAAERSGYHGSQESRKPPVPDPLRHVDRSSLRIQQGCQAHIY